MPTPRESRLSTPILQPKSEGDHQRNWNALEQVIDRLPFFPQYERHVLDPSGLTIVSNSSPQEMNLSGQGLQRIPFQKVEPWTEVFVSIDLMGYSNVGGTTINFGGTFYRLDSRTATTAPQIGKFRFSAAHTAQHTALWGRRRLQLPAGRYEFRPTWWVGAGEFRFDQSDSLFISVTEVVPVPQAVRLI